MADILALDAKLSRNAASGRGVKLTGDDLALLASIGALDVVSQEKAKFIKEQAVCRTVSTKEGAFGLPPKPAKSSTSAGTTSDQEKSDAKARVHRMFQ
jgi:hypothetical protein